jgi:capsular polysaccharide transport system permease protein
LSDNGKSGLGALFSKQGIGTAQARRVDVNAPHGDAPQVQPVRAADIPTGNAAPVGAATKAAPVATPSEPPQDPPDFPILPTASKADLAGKSRDEIREIRKEERRLQRVVEGRAPAQPGDPVPHAPPTLEQKKSGKGKSKKKVASDVYVAPMAEPAQMRQRHWGVLLSLLIIVVLPLAVIGFYLNQRAVDQYASTVGFTVRSEDGGGSALTGLLTSFGGGGSQTDTDILYEFIQSQSLVARVQSRFDLKAHYSVPYDVDPVYALKPDATAEDLLSYWSRVVTVSYNQTSKLIEMRVQAFDAQTAQSVAQAILEDSQELINQLNAQARDDALRYSIQDLEDAQARLRSAREALIRFRTRTQIVDPEIDLQGRLGVVNSLQQLLAEKLIEQDLLPEARKLSMNDDIAAIRNRISEERASVTSGDVASFSGEAYPELLAKYEGLQADLLFAEETYRAALISLDASKANATRQNRYLATYIPPTLPQTAEYPRRWMTFGLAALFLVLAWSVLVLIYYSIRDSK